jgi:site-specific DNA-adenine methylase
MPQNVIKGKLQEIDELKSLMMKQERFELLLRSLIDSGGNNLDTPFIGELYSGFIIMEEAQRAINSKGSKRTGHKEAKSVLNK